MKTNKLFSITLISGLLLFSCLVQAAATGITYLGNPAHKNINESSGGDVHGR